MLGGRGDLHEPRELLELTATRSKEFSCVRTWRDNSGDLDFAYIVIIPTHCIVSKGSVCPQVQFIQTSWLYTSTQKSCPMKATCDTPYYQHSI